MTVRVVAHLTAQPDKIEETRALLASLTGPTRREQGCLRYDLLQSNSIPSDFTFDEEWTSDAALDAHLKAPHITAALERFAGLLVAPPDIRRYSQIA